MLTSLAFMILMGLLMGSICKKLRVPSLFGMIITGMILGPYALNVMDRSILDISSELRRIALIIILIRAGLSLDIADLKKVGRPAIFMCFLPACFEITGMVILAPKLLEMSILDAAILGAVIAAVSPAVIVPKMLKLMDEGYGVKKAVPQMILAGASVDDVFVIVMFSTFTGLAQGNNIGWTNFATIPISIIIGVLIGLAAGAVLALLFTKFHIRDTVKMMIIVSAAFILVTMEDLYGQMIPFASLIAVMGMGIAIQKKRQEASIRLSERFSKLWVMAEIILFVLVGATVDLENAASAGWRALVLLLGVLVFRMIGVLICLIGTPLNRKERLFCMLAYTPKATVQAAIGGLPLAMGLDCGNMVLTVSVLAILITAPLGAFAIDLTYKKLLGQEVLS